MARTDLGGIFVRAAIALWLALTPVRPAGAAEEALPIFDTHVHYSRDAWTAYDPDAILKKLDGAGVTRALVSSTPDDGTVTLRRHGARRVVAELRPYHGDVHSGNWVRSPEIVAYLEARLKKGFYRAIGEVHLHGDEDARTPTVQQVAALAVAYDIPLHVHAGAGPVAALFAMEPRLQILWAHAGFVEPAPVVAAMLERYDRLMTEVSFRAHDIAPGGTLSDDWRMLFERHAERIMIGTDTYVTERWDVYQSLIDEHRAWLRQLPRATAEALAFGNASRLFGAPPPSR